MKDGFDKSVAEKMPKSQKQRGNRPWNVDPVLIKKQDEEATDTTNAKPLEVRPIPQIIAKDNFENANQAVQNIEDLNSELTNMIFEKKNIARQLNENNNTLDTLIKENTFLKQNIVEIEKRKSNEKVLHNEIMFLNEQLQDADCHIKNLFISLDDKTKSLNFEADQKRGLEKKYLRIAEEVHDKAKLDVKVSILRRDLEAANARVRDLEILLDDEQNKRKPLEEEIVDLKTALDKVYSSLNQIRLKAKREAYGS